MDEVTIIEKRPQFYQNGNSQWSTLHKVLLNGVEIKGINSIMFHTPIGELNKVVLELIGPKIVYIEEDLET